MDTAQDMHKIMEETEKELNLALKDPEMNKMIQDTTDSFTSHITKNDDINAAATLFAEMTVHFLPTHSVSLYQRGSKIIAPHQRPSVNLVCPQME
jgi:hypothetical protein